MYWNESYYLIWKCKCYNQTFPLESGSTAQIAIAQQKVECLVFAIFSYRNCQYLT